MNALTRPPAQPLTLSTADGVELGGTLFTAASPRAAVLVVGAMATPHRYYRHVGSWLAKRGITTLTFDYRGIGASRRGSLRGDRSTLRDWATHDVTAALAALRTHAPGMPVFAIGHSFGGQALGLSDALGTVDGVLTVGAQLGWWGHGSGLARWRMWATWHLLFPIVLATVGYVPGRLGLGEDLPPRVAAEWARWCRSPRYLLDHVPDAEARLRAFRGAAEVWAISDDDYAPEAAVRALAAHVGPGGAWVRTVTPRRTQRPIGHFGTFRPELAGTLWEDVDDVLTGWIG
jgi:predicted alpha/beta hydrolase